MKINFTGLITLSWILIFHFILFGPRFIFLDFFYLNIILLSFIFLFFYSFNKFLIPKQFLLFFGLFFISFFYLLIVAAAYSFRDLIFINDYFKIPIFIFATLFIVNFASNKFIDFEFAINKFIYYATVLNGLIVIFTQFSPFVRNHILPILGFKLATSWDVLSGIRSTDWSMGGGTALSFVFFIVYVLGKSYKSKLTFYHECNFILILACFFTGRMGFYSLFLFEIIHFFYLKIISSTKLDVNHFPNISFKKVFLYFIIIVLFTLNINNVVDVDLLVDRVLPWAFESFYSFNDTGLASSRTTEIILNEFYFLPSSNLKLFFGSLDFVPQTDVGYIKVIHYMGLVGLILLLIPFLYIFYISFKNIKTIKSAPILLFYLLVIAVINFKEMFLMNSRTGFLLLMIWFSIVIIKSNKMYIISQKNPL